MKLKPLGFFFFFFSLLAHVFAASPAASQPVQTQRIYGLEVRGSAVFIQKTKEALDLLFRNHSLAVVQRYVKVIQAGERSGMKAYLEPPVYEVGMPTWNHSAIWYAGTIAHDAYHSKLYRDAKEKTGKEPDSSVWTGTEAERLCLKYQMEILKKIGADSKTLLYVQNLEKNPTYQGNPESEADYQKRWW